MKVLWYLFCKDIRIEFRQKELVVVGVCLALLLAAIAAFGVQSAFLKSAYEQALVPALVWILFLFAATTVLGRSFVHELEYQAIELLLQYRIAPELLYVSKLLSIFCVNSLIFTVVFAALVVFLNIPAAGIGLTLAICSLLVVFGYTAVAVLFSALTGRSGQSALLFPVIILPLLFPLFFAGIELFAAILLDGTFRWSHPWLSLLLAADVVYFLLGFNLFRFAIRR